MLLRHPMQTLPPSVPLAEAGGAAAPGPVLILTPWHRPLLGGVVEVAERLRVGLTAAGVETHLLVLDEKRGLVPGAATPGIWRMAIPTGFFSGDGARASLSTVLRAPGALADLAGFVRRKRIATAILLFPIEYSWAPLLLHHVTGLRLIASLHGEDLRRHPDYPRQFRWLLRRLLRSAGAVTVPSLELAGHLEGLVPRDEVALVHMPNGVDTSRFTPRPSGHRRADPRPTVLHVSNFAPLKRTVDLVDAFAGPAVPAEARLVFVGEGPTLEATRARVRERGLEDRVEFRARQAEVRPFLWDADVLALPSDRESSPLVLLEAMACGVPWVATGFGAAAETPRDACGLVVPSREPAALGAALGRVLGDAALAARLGGEGRRLAVERYDLRVYIQRHLALLAGRPAAAAGAAAPDPARV